MWTLCSSNLVLSQGNSTNLTSCIFPAESHLWDFDAKIMMKYWDTESFLHDEHFHHTDKTSLKYHHTNIIYWSTRSWYIGRFDRSEKVTIWQMRTDNILKIPVSWSEHSQEEAPHPTILRQPWCVVSWVWAELCPRSFLFCGLLGCISDDSCPPKKVPTQ